MNAETIKELTHKYVLNTYGDRGPALVRGKGSDVWDASGTQYLDFLTGLSVTSLGHCHPHVVEAIKAQAETLLHVSNLYYIEPQVKLARKLVEISFGDKCFFCNSGAEANEAAIKLARKWGNGSGQNRYEIITVYQSFHGRTLATVTATGQEKFQQGFDPLPQGFKHVPLNDLQALEAAISEKTCAIMLEPIQVEGGVQVPSEDYLPGVRQICDDRNLLLVLDEVQTGLGRTGRLFGYECWGITPDIMTLAKSLGGGTPIGTMITTDRLADVLKVSDHASTFGGNPLVCAAALATLEVLTEEGFLERARQVSDHLFSRVRHVAAQHELAVELRGMGMILGLELTCPAKGLVERFQEKGILVGTAGQNVLRMLPALIATTDEVDRVVNVLDEILSGMEQTKQ